jgi:D-sedoheptulose 7-phosphate isomerase
MKQWIQDYKQAQKAAIDSIPDESVSNLIELLHKACQEDRQVFVFANGGSAANATHFATDLGKGASDKLPKRFRVMSLNDNTSWMTAIGNDYSYEDLFVRQLMNFARPGDIVLTMSVSGNSPNLVKAFQWAKEKGLVTVAFLSERRGKLADIADHSIIIKDSHYGRAEDAHMMINHMICYAFMEHKV